MMEITLTVNGIRKKVYVKPNVTLLSVLRRSFNVRSVRPGCFRGECGSCTVIMNGELVKSCLVLAAQTDGAEIITVEGLSRPGVISPIQRAFIAKFGFQCGFCTPAFILAGYWIAINMPNATEEEIKEILNGIICRCTGYKQILDSIKYGIKLHRKEKG